MNRINAQDPNDFHPVHLCKFKIGLYFSVVLCVLSTAAMAEEYRFDVTEYEKKPYHLGGYAEMRPVLLGLDRDAALYHLRLFDRNEGKTTAEYNGRFLLEGSLERGFCRFFVRINSRYQSSYRGETLQTTFYDGYLTIRPAPAVALEGGKKSLRWGTGYAWNPVAFIDRPKDPDDPELNLEGFILASVSYIKSFAGPLRTLSLTPVFLPVDSGINDEFGKSDHLNVGGKLYALVYDTDIDLVFLTGGSKTDRYGFDFARNITPNFEVHGEFAHFRNVRRRVVDSAGNFFERKSAEQSYLLGFRYLTESETTWIAEYYHNGTGFTEDEMANYFAFVDRGFDAFLADGDRLLLQLADCLGKEGYTGMTPMRDYLYVRATQKEPFDILYFTPAVTGIVNLNDSSFSLSPELIYTGFTNLEVRLKGTWLEGGALSEFGEKQNDGRVELRIRYYL